MSEGLPFERTKCELTLPAFGAFQAVHTFDFGALYQLDALVFLRQLNNESTQTVIADPPYAIGKARWDYFKSLEDYVVWCDEWIKECQRILKPGGSLFVCGFSEILAEIKVRSSKHFDGLKWLVWYYRNKANLGKDWGRSHESLLHFRKGKIDLHIDPLRIPYNGHTTKYPKRVQSESSQYHSPNKKKETWQPHPLGAKPRDVIEVPVLCNGMEERTKHPTQKPEKLIEKLVLGTSSQGDLVVDPFSGSGTTAVVSEKHRRIWLCSDREDEYLNMAAKRLDALKPVD